MLLEADRDQVGPVELCELEGASAVDGYTRSLGGMETPGALVVARIPSVVVPVCVLTSVAKCVLKRAHSVGERLCVRETACVRETHCVRETACVREWYDREMAVGMREHTTACPSESVMVRCVSVMARGSACVEWRRRRHQTRDKGHAAAVAVSSTTSDLHSSAREVRAVLRTRRRVRACASEIRSGNARGGCKPIPRTDKS